MATPGTLINNKYRVARRIGGGSFGEIYMGVGPNYEKVAIKFERVGTRCPQLRHEYKVYRELLNSHGVCSVYYFGTQDNYNVMVMDLLGPSLEDLFNKCARRFSLKTVLQLADQMLERVDTLHSRHLIHRDIKPANFVVGIRDPNIFCVDFGLSKRYCHPTSLQHIRYRDGKSLTGTPRYASINNHLGIEQSRRDDLESIGYVLVYFLKGSLPWQGLQGKNTQLKYRLILEKKQQVSIAQLCQGCPSQFAEFLAYTRSLTFDAKPDIPYLRKLFRDLYDARGCAILVKKMWDWDAADADYCSAEEDDSGDDDNMDDDSGDDDDSEEDDGGDDDDSGDDDSGDDEKNTNKKSSATATADADTAAAGGGGGGVAEKPPAAPDVKPVAGSAAATGAGGAGGAAAGAAATAAGGAAAGAAAAGAGGAAAAATGAGGAAAGAAAAGGRGVGATPSARPGNTTGARVVVSVKLNSTQQWKFSCQGVASFGGQAYPPSVPVSMAGIQKDSPHWTTTHPLYSAPSVKHAADGGGGGVGTIPGGQPSNTSSGGGLHTYRALVSVMLNRPHQLEFSRQGVASSGAQGLPSSVGIAGMQKDPRAASTQPNAANV